jgi:asparagine synthase (glutamine-hydrolysing)
MAHGLEGRSPFLDRALIEHAATLPDDLRRRGASGKVILKQLGRALLPEGILDRPKRGCGVPLAAWFRGELRPMLRDALMDRPRLARRLREPALRRLVEDHLAGRADHEHTLWMLLTLELWLRKHGLD